MNNILLLLLLYINVSILVSKLIIMHPFIFVGFLIFYFNLKAIIFFMLYRLSKEVIIENVLLYKKYIVTIGIVLGILPFVSFLGLDVLDVHLIVLTLPAFIVFFFVILIDLIKLRNILFNLIFIFYIATYLISMYIILVIQSGEL